MTSCFFPLYKGPTPLQPYSHAACRDIQRSYNSSPTKTLQPYSHTACRSVGGLFSGNHQKTFFSRIRSVDGGSMTPLAKKVAELFGRPETPTSQPEKQPERHLALVHPTSPAALTLGCPHCHGAARPNGGTLSKDETNYIQFWRCLSPTCRAQGSTVYRLQ